jgi:hypothetical protein
MIPLPKLDLWPEDWYAFRQQIEYKLSNGLDKLLNKSNNKPKVEFISKFKKRPEESRSRPDDPARITTLIIEHAPVTVQELIRYLKDPRDWPNLESLILCKEVDSRLLQISVHIPTNVAFDSQGKYDKERAFKSRCVPYYSRDTLFIQDANAFTDDYDTLLEKIILSERDAKEEDGVVPIRFARNAEGGVVVITPEKGFEYEEVGPCVTYNYTEDYSKWIMKKVVYVTDCISSLEFIEKCEKFRQMVNKGSDFSVLVPDAYVDGESGIAYINKKPLSGELDNRIRIFCKKKIVFGSQGNAVKPVENDVGSKIRGKDQLSTPSGIPLIRRERRDGRKRSRADINPDARVMFPKKQKQVVAPETSGIVNLGNDTDLLDEEAY